MHAEEVAHATSLHLLSLFVSFCFGIGVTPEVDSHCAVGALDDAAPKFDDANVVLVGSVLVTAGDQPPHLADPQLTPKIATTPFNLFCFSSGT
nr:unnamed protein product [Digitaria exilis]